MADTILKKGIELLLDKAMPSTGKKLMRPSAAALTAIIRNSNGDIRSAINNVQFLIREAKHSSLKILTEAPTKGKKRTSSGKFKDDDDAELCVCTVLRF